MSNIQPYAPVKKGMLTKNGSEYAIPDALYEEFVVAYGEEMVRQECEAMRLWLITNPTNRKTISGMPKFMNSWLKRTKATGGMSPFAPQHTSKQIKKTESGDETIRGKSIAMSLTDITFLDLHQQEVQKQYFLQEYGYYYAGGGVLKYA